MLYFSFFNKFCLGLTFGTKIKFAFGFIHPFFNVVVVTSFTRLKNWFIPRCVITIRVTTTPEKDFTFSAGLLNHFSFAIFSRTSNTSGNGFSVAAIRIFFTTNITSEPASFYLKRTPAFRTRFFQWFPALNHHRVIWHCDTQGSLSRRQIFHRAYSI